MERMIDWDQFQIGLGVLVLVLVAFGLGKAFERERQSSREFDIRQAKDQIKYYCDIIDRPNLADCLCANEDSIIAAIDISHRKLKYASQHIVALIIISWNFNKPIDQLIEASIDLDTFDHISWAQSIVEGAPYKPAGY